MINKRFLYGVGLGLLGSKLYPKVKKNIKPVTRKIVKNVIIIGENTRTFINEISKEIKKETNIYNIEIKKDKHDELRVLKEEQRNAVRRITELKRQLEDVSKKVDNL
ncbi:hypothetical protein [Clostridium sp. DJ247]|uniref:hypothetical protein n=1 Tax=Clostridium sp. DJ247 TaxID=2726188 RepID=UPI001627EBEF|nr:hypothetical protein [Clostridium sp. DJ247]MBC2581317.1 hypothetical protein [Clostridium sp. DJ247]